MKGLKRPGPPILMILLASSFGVSSLYAKPDGGHGGRGRGASSAGQHAKGVKPARDATNGTKTPSAQLTKNARLASRLQGLLPAKLDVFSAVTGFRSLGQFIAAIHVSRNLGIPFDRLKTEMVDSGQSLGRAIHHLKPGADPGLEGGRAEAQADQELRRAGLIHR